MVKIRRVTVKTGRNASKGELRRGIFNQGKKTELGSIGKQMILRQKRGKKERQLFPTEGSDFRNAPGHLFHV